MVYVGLFQSEAEKRTEPEAVTILQSACTRTSSCDLSVTDFTQNLVARSPQKKASSNRQVDQYHMEPLGPPPPVYNPELAPPAGFSIPQETPTATSPQEPIDQTFDIERGIDSLAGEPTPGDDGPLHKSRNSMG